MKTARTVLILGGTSAIGAAIARCYATHGWRIVLAARQHSEAQRHAADLTLRHGAEVSCLEFNVVGPVEQPTWKALFDIQADTVVCVVGMLGTQARAETDQAHAAEILRSNFEGPALLLSEFANQMVVRGSGTIVGVSSVAGDRGRASNYFYGSAKAGFTAFLSGLRNRLTSRGIHVLTVKPGFVRTAMTEGMDLPERLTAMPDEVGRAVYAAAEIHKSNVIYVRPIWRLLMGVIGLIPESRFKKMRL